MWVVEDLIEEELYGPFNSGKEAQEWGQVNREKLNRAWIVRLVNPPTD